VNASLRMSPPSQEPPGPSKLTLQFLPRDYHRFGRWESKGFAGGGGFIFGLPAGTLFENAFAHWPPTEPLLRGGRPHRHDQFSLERYLGRSRRWTFLQEGFSPSVAHVTCTIPISRGWLYP